MLIKWKLYKSRRFSPVVYLFKYWFRLDYLLNAQWYIIDSIIHANKWHTKKYHTNINFNKTLSSTNNSPQDYPVRHVYMCTSALPGTSETYITLQHKTVSPPESKNSACICASMVGLTYICYIACMQYMNILYTRLCNKNCWVIAWMHFLWSGRIKLHNQRAVLLYICHSTFNSITEV